MSPRAAAWEQSLALIEIDPGEELTFRDIARRWGHAIRLLFPDVKHLPSHEHVRQIYVSAIRKLRED